MALPAHKLDPLPDPPRFPREVLEEPSEAVFRPLRKPNGEVVVEKLPLTLDVLLNPREEDQMTQSKYHERQLGPFADSLARCLERREGVAVFSDMLILWKQLGGGARDVAPDVCVVKGVRDREAIDTSFDPVAEGTGPCLVFEVVSESTADVKAKDEVMNPPLFARMGVEDLVLIYPWRPKQQRRLRLDVKRLSAAGGYRPNRPGPDGWYLLASMGLRIKPADDGVRLLVEDVLSGERLLTSVEEEAARRAAEARLEQETEARRKAEEEKNKAERRNREMAAEIERLRAQLGGHEEGEA
jgi:Uma2 family endonuclease